MSDNDPWHPDVSPINLKHLGKLLEELNECGSAAARCMIQGIDERDPETGKINHVWLSEEMADVLANIELNIDHFGLDRQAIMDRAKSKAMRLKTWHQQLK